jgi:hypothetical protein
MKKSKALIAVLLYIFTLSACGEVAPISADTTTTASITEATASEVTIIETTTTVSVTQETTTTKTPETEPTTTTATTIDISGLPPAERLEAIAQNVSQNRLSYGLMDADSGEIVFEYNENEEFEAGSTTKGTYIWYVYKDNISETGMDDDPYYGLEHTTRYHERVYHISDNSVTYDAFKSGQLQFTMEELLYNTVYYDDDEAYLILKKTFRVNDYKKRLSEFGSTTELSESDMFGAATASNRLKEYKAIYDYYKSGSNNAKTFDTNLTNTNTNLFYEATGVVSRYMTELDDGYCHEAGYFTANSVKTYVYVVFSDLPQDDVKEILKAFYESI